MRYLIIFLLAFSIAACEKNEDDPDYSTPDGMYRGTVEATQYTTVGDTTGSDTTLTDSAIYRDDSLTISNSRQNAATVFYHRVGQEHQLSRAPLTEFSATIEATIDTIVGYEYDLSINVDSLVGEIEVQKTENIRTVYDLSLIKTREPQ